MRAAKILVLSRLVRYFVQAEEIYIAEAILVAAAELEIVPTKFLTEISAVNKLALRW